MKPSTMIAATVLTTAALLGFLVSSGQAVSCYDCAATDDICKDPFDESKVILKNDCGYCSKIKLETNSSHTVTRSCLPAAGGHVPESRCASSSAQGVTTQACFCNEDECNGVPDVSKPRSNVSKVIMTSRLLLGVLFLGSVV